MRPLGALLFTAFVVLLMRSTALATLATHGLVIDALAFATVVWALRHGEAWGATFGFFVGLSADLDAAHWLGRHALVLTLIGYGVGRLSRTLVRDSGRTQFVLIAVATLAHQTWTAVFDLSGGIVGLPLVGQQLLSATVLTAALGTFLLTGLRRLAGRPVFGDASSTPSSH